MPALGEAGLWPGRGVMSREQFCLERRAPSIRSKQGTSGCRLSPDCPQLHVAALPMGSPWWPCHTACRGPGFGSGPCVSCRSTPCCHRAGSADQSLCSTSRHSLRSPPPAIPYMGNSNMGSGGSGSALGVRALCTGQRTWGPVLPPKRCWHEGRRNAVGTGESPQQTSGPAGHCIYLAPRELCKMRFQLLSNYGINRHQAKHAGLPHAALSVVVALRGQKGQEMRSKTRLMVNVSTVSPQTPSRFNLALDAGKHDTTARCQ